MSIIAAKPIRTLRLDFIADDRKKLVRENLSAVAASGDQLWFGTDEDTLLDCLTEAGGDRYAGHKTFELKNSLQLPNTTGKKDEIDIEGLYVAGERLWLVGSHAITRDRPNPGEDGAKKALRDLSDVKKGPNRWTLASWALPQPTVLILESDASVRFVGVSPDWLDRPEADVILAALPECDRAARAA